MNMYLIVLAVVMALILAIHFYYKVWGKGHDSLWPLILLAIPFLGALIYVVIFMWSPPPPQPHKLRQNQTNHYRSKYGEEPIKDYKPNEKH